MDEHFLTLALGKAMERRGFTAPNPAVGAVLVREGRLLASGLHWGAGHPHAEALALEKFRDRAAGATLYVTLEPCNHVGRTPPCTRLIKECGIERVVYGFKDPNSKVRGHGHHFLKDAGIAVEQLALRAIDDFYRSYYHWCLTGLPWVCVKIAQSLDGKVAGHAGRPQKISSAVFDAFTHERRLRCDALLSSATTVINDNPRLDARGEKEAIGKRVYVVDSNLRLPSRRDLNVFQTTSELVLLHGPERSHSDEMGVRYLSVPRDGTGLCLRCVVERIGKEGMHELWVEFGSSLVEGVWQKDLVDELIIGVAPQYLGAQGMPGPTLKIGPCAVSWKIVGRDAMCRIEKHHVYRDSGSLR